MKPRTSRKVLGVTCCAEQPILGCACSNWSAVPHVLAKCAHQAHQACNSRGDQTRCYLGWTGIRSDMMKEPALFRSGLSCSCLPIGLPPDGTGPSCRKWCRFGGPCDCLGNHSVDIKSIGIDKPRIERVYRAGRETQFHPRRLLLLLNPKESLHAHAHCSP